MQQLRSAGIRVAEALQDGASDEVERARLLAARDKDSGAWLQALPITSVGLRMDDNTLRTAVGLRLGTAICAPHNCQLCGAQVSQFGTHGLSCRSSEGRHPRHAAINDIICRTLSSAGIPARLEPPGLLRSDGKRPDGMTWTSGRPLVWDATCSDTFAESYRSQATSGAGCVAALAEVKVLLSTDNLPIPASRHRNIWRSGFGETSETANRGGNGNVIPSAAHLHGSSEGDTAAIMGCARQL